MMCQCCGAAAIDGMGGWCADCVYAVQRDVMALRDLTPGARAIMADLFRTVPAEALARAVVGVVPFGPPYERMMQ